MKQLDKNEALKLLESFEDEKIELEQLIRNACSIIYSVAEQMSWETAGAFNELFRSLAETAQAIFELNKYPNILK